jgi:hypothetical protein
MDPVLVAILILAVVIGVLVKFAIDHRRAQRASGELDSIRLLADPSHGKKDEDR